MQLVEQQVIDKNHEHYDYCARVTRLSKNLYNASLYEVRQVFFNTKKHKTWQTLKKEFTANNNRDYRALPTKVATQTLRKVGQDYSSFFALWELKQQGKYDKKVSIPKYKKKTGHTLITFPKESIAKKPIKQGELYSHTVCPRDSSLKLTIKSQHANLDNVRIIPKNNHYVIESVYTVPDVETKPDNGKYASIDLGVSNLMSVFYNFDTSSELYNGRHVKNINHYYNKKRAKLQSTLHKCNNAKTSHKLEALINKRNRKINNELHVMSTMFVNHAVSLDVSKVIIGKNKNWKQDINIGKRNNQNFVSIPHARLIDLLTYKLKLRGINVVLKEESYTSKCSALDKELVRKRSKYAGRRVKRGLFKTSTGLRVNADINGAINIMRKAVPDELVYFDGIEGVAVHPVKVLPIRK